MLAIQLALTSATLAPAVPVLAQAPAAPMTVRAVRLGQWPDRLRLVLETDRDMPFRLVSGASGEQLIVILEGMDHGALTAALKGQIPADHGLISSYYLSVHGPDAARLEVRFRYPVTANLFNLRPDHGYGYRLVIDLFAGGREGASVDGMDRDAGATPAKVTTASSVASPQSAAVADNSLAPAVAAPDSPVSASDESSKGSSAEVLWLEASLNNQRQRTTVLALYDEDDQLLLSAADLRQWRIAVPEQGGLEYQGERFYSLAELGIQVQLDLRQLTLDLQAPATLFDDTALDGPQRDRLTLTPSGLGAFFNYDLSATHSDAEDTIRRNGFFELGAFNGWGSGTSTFLARPDSVGSESTLVRLDTAWRKDNPDTMRTLSLGDASSSATGWSGAVRFGGLQWGTNFSTRPEFLTMPLMTIGGEATLPSTVDLYVNDALRLRREVPPGPFTIDEIPTITGRGQTRLVVRDILGREQIITEDFYLSQRLLRAGLKEYSVELGVVRENYGQQSNDYGRPLASATWRSGLTDRLTIEAHGQVLADGEGRGEQQMAGLGASWLLPFGGLLYSALASSHSEGGQGQLLNLGLQRQGRVFSLGFDSQLASEDFVRLGMVADQPLPSQQTRIYASLAGWGAGSLNIGYTRQDYRQRDDVEFVNLGYSLGMGKLGYLSLSALHFVDTSETSVRLSFTLPLGMERSSATFSASRGADRSEGEMQVQRSLPAGTGFGYRLQAGLGDSDQRQGSLGYQNNYGTYLLEGSRTNGQTGIRASMRGGVALLGGGVFPGRSIDNSFAVVTLPGFPGVRIYAENQEVARTNGKGEALIPRLRAYERNRISIEQADLPFDANVSGLELEVSPYFRSGVTLAFPVEHTRDAFFSLVDEGGEPLPVGAVVTTASGEHFPVGMRGEVFLTDLQALNELEARWPGQRCRFTLEVPDSDEPLLELGQRTCTGINP